MKYDKTSLPDTPLNQSSNDFGTEGYVQGLIQFIRNSAAPITIALQGEWGSGKTSLMNRLYNELCADGKGFFGININTWEYSMLSTPEETVLKIIGQLIFTLTERDAQASSKAKQYMKSVLNFAWGAGREFAKGLFPGAGLLIEGLRVPSECPSGEKNDNAHVSLSELREVLDKAIEKTLSETKKSGILIFVDDLDRLNPPLAVQVLELLKNIFTLENCIFVLAIDYEVVVKGLEPKFGKLSDANEREFRSFFDKIIQVPFSLPVNNYKPFDFVLNSLESIGYISHTERKIPYVKDCIEKIVVSSVGKNPRSIKRLINTLSLLDCIAKNSGEDQSVVTFEEKIINFAVVALQVCYPKIYGLLTINPNFRKWNKDLAQRMNIRLENADDPIDGEAILDELCSKDAYLNKHHADIVNLLTIIEDNVAQLNIGNRGEQEQVMRKILDRSSVTGVNVEAEAEELDKRAFVQSLHDNILRYVTMQKPDLSIKPKRISGSHNGGFFLTYPTGEKTEIILRPSQNEGKVNLQMWIQLGGPRPKPFVGMDFETFYYDAKVQAIVNPFEQVVNKLCNLGIMEGTYKPDGMVFKSFAKEWEYRGRKGWLDKVFSCHGDFTITFDSIADYEDASIVGAMGDLVIATYDFNAAVKQLV